LHHGLHLASISIAIKYWRVRQEPTQVTLLGILNPKINALCRHESLSYRTFLTCHERLSKLKQCLPWKELSSQSNICDYFTSLPTSYLQLTRDILTTSFLFGQLSSPGSCTVKHFSAVISQSVCLCQAFSA
jgi:hypothetical protein